MANEFDYAETVGKLRGAIDALECWEGDANDLMNEIDWVMVQVNTLDIQQDDIEDIGLVHDQAKRKLTAIHDAINEAVPCVDDLLDAIKRLPMSE